MHPGLPPVLVLQMASPAMLPVCLVSLGRATAPHAPVAAGEQSLDHVPCQVGLIIMQLIHGRKGIIDMRGLGGFEVSTLLVIGGWWPSTVVVGCEQV